MKNQRIIFVFSILLLLTANISPQSGGTFAITQSVIAGGGGQNASGGVFSVDGTAGQPVAGANSSGGLFSLRGGFWSSPLAPTAASVSVGGRVRTTSGKGIRNVVVTLTEPSGTIRSVQSGTFGKFKFENVEVGGTYIISVFAKRFRFDQPTIIRAVLEEIADLEFVAADQ